jgi:hypothetical protein
MHTLDIVLLVVGSVRSLDGGENDSQQERRLVVPTARVGVIDPGRT